MSLQFYKLAEKEEVWWKVAALIAALIFFTAAFQIYFSWKKDSIYCHINLHIYDKNDILKTTDIFRNNRSLRLVCYYSFPKKEADLMPEMISDLCTHINVAFASIDTVNFSLVLLPDQLDILSRLHGLKVKNKEVHILISVGGAGFSDFGQMVATHSTRKLFIRSAMELIKSYHLDGLDIDWEWPVLSGNKYENIKFIQLLYELRQEFNRHEKKYLLTAAVAAAENIIDLAYYVAHMAEHVDFVNVMTYDYHFYTSFYPVTDYNAPLYPAPEDENSLLATLNINFTINYWLLKGMPREKIVLGLPTYGHTFRLFSSMNHGRHAPAQGLGDIGQDGFVSYPQICSFLQKYSTISVFDNSSKVPYAYNFLDWISYDDESSLAIKAQYIIDEQLGGGMIWSLNEDDFLGSCKSPHSNFPLIKTIREILFKL